MLCADGNNYFVFDKERWVEMILELGKGVHPLKALFNVFPDDCLRLEKQYKSNFSPEIWDMKIFVTGMLLGANPEFVPKDFNEITDNREFYEKCVKKMMKSALVGKNGEFKPIK